MLVGVILGYARFATFLGTVSVIGLQIARIRIEEDLLRASFPALYATFVARTNFRLTPFLW